MIACKRVSVVTTLATKCLKAMDFLEPYGSVHGLISPEERLLRKEREKERCHASEEK